MVFKLSSMKSASARPPIMDLKVTEIVVLSSSGSDENCSRIDAMIGRVVVSTSRCCFSDSTLYPDSGD